MPLTGLPPLLAPTLTAETGAEPRPADVEAAATSAASSHASGTPRETAFVLPTFGVRFFGPLQASLAFGLGVATPAKRGPLYRGGFLEVEPGIGGLQFNAGAFTGNEWGAASLRLAYLRLWGHPAGTEADRHYLGLEPALQFARIKVSLGVYRRLWSPSGSPWLFGATLGYGYP